jgi:hypothetical protein
MAKRQPETTELVTEGELRVLREKLKGFVLEIEECLTVVGEGLFVFKTASRDLGVDRLDSFFNALKESRFALLQGTPHNSSTRKTAASLKKPVTSHPDEDTGGEAYRRKAREAREVLSRAEEMNVEIWLPVTPAKAKPWFSAVPTLVEPTGLIRMSQHVNPIKASKALIKWSDWTLHLNTIREIMLRILRENRSIQIRVDGTAFEIRVERPEDLPLAVNQVNQLIETSGKANAVTPLPDENAGGEQSNTTKQTGPGKTAKKTTARKKLG